MLDSNSIVYYPTIEFRDENWLKAALLIWDNIYRIVPYDYIPNDSDEVKFAIDSGRIKSITLQDEDLESVYKKYESFLENLEFIPDGLHNNDGTTKVHKDKISSRLYPLMESLAKEFDGEWFDLPTEAARGYMQYLSQIVAENRQFSLATDNADSWIMSAYVGEKGNFSEMVYDMKANGQYTSVELLDLIPTDVKHLGIKEIIEHTSYTKDERNEFRSVASEFLDKLTLCSTEDGTYEATESYKDELNRVKKQFQDSTSFMGTELARSSIIVGIPTSLTAFGTLTAMSQASITSNIFQSVSFGLVAAIADYSKVKKEGRGPALGSYLIDLDRQKGKQHLSQDFNYIMDQFIND